MKKFIAVLVLATALFACDIDRFPYNAIATEELFESEGALASATAGNYAILKGDDNGFGFIHQTHRIPEYAGDNVSLSGTTTNPLFYTYNYFNSTTTYLTNTVWSVGYKAIVGCNRIIEMAEEGVSQGLDHQIGENYFLRAYALFYMNNVFGRPYSQGTSNLGVPIKLTTREDDNPDRATVGEVYDQIVSDLLKAESLMSLPKDNIFATKEAAQALLSRVYLYMEQNDKAIEYANKVIGKFSLVSTSDFPKYFEMVPEENPETIFCFKYTETEYNESNPWRAVGSLYARIDGVGWGEMYASKPIIDLYDQNPGDVRRSFIWPQYLEDDNGNLIPAVYWVDNSYKYQFRDTYVENGKTYFDDGNTQYEVLSETQGNQTKYYFTSNGTKIYVTKDFDMEKRNGYPRFYITKASLQEGIGHLWSPVISRLGEVILNRAEAYAKLGNVNLALADVNTIRARAGIPTYNSPSDFPAGKTLIDVVLDERRMELAWEGHRKYDIFRNNKTLDRRYPGTHLSGANPYEMVLPTDDRVVEYVPQAQINAQPSLIQNPPLN
ncbi:RagB/SusD family nutrient uptake outer membrane protein [Aestuariivivens insulae]|uniref:RagB/SusD family nutrient uptake outer membrane protein n=1 Tax=Aestuariivivens insulae TaxID=1621988 RepID=UPI001F5ABAFE|nr:RagB/SusD family nutrient uptake outer membrane protein [Aestuariivivens insulae]